MYCVQPPSSVHHTTIQEVDEREEGGDQWTLIVLILVLLHYTLTDAFFILNRGKPE